MIVIHRTDDSRMEESMGRWKITGYVGIIICLLSGCTRSTDAIPILNESVRGKEDTAFVECGDLYRIEYYDAVTVPVITEVLTKQDGILDKLMVTIGDTVKEGDVLATFQLEKDFDHGTKHLSIDDVVYEIEKQQLEIEIAQGQLKLYNSKVVLSSKEEQEQKLLELVLKEMELKLKTLTEVTEHKVDVEEDNQMLTQASDEVIVMKAPCNGRIAYRTESIKGDLIRENAVMFSITQEDVVIEGKDISSSVMEKADRVYATFHGDEFNIIIDTTGADRDGYLNETQNKVYFIPKEEDINLEAGSYIPIYVISEIVNNAVYIPIDALKVNDEGYYVYIITDVSREKRKVDIGMITSSNVEILFGVTKGEVVLVSE
jgi:multidrug efflux pump subunit AcrA (membrane-fusion protein)